MTDDDILLPVPEVARILRISPQALWRLIHAGEMGVVWDKGFHAIRRKSLIAYLEAAVAEAKAARAEDLFVDDSPLGYVRVAVAPRNRILDGTLEPGTRVRVKSSAEELGWSEDTVRKGMVILTRTGYLHQFPGSAGYVVKEVAVNQGGAPSG